MKKTLGAVALAGASALMLASYAGDAPAEPETGDITVWLVGADTPPTHSAALDWLSLVSLGVFMVYLTYYASFVNEESLDEILDALNKDREFLTRGGVFSNEMLDAYIELKMQEVTRLRMTTHPVEFDMYYSL